MSPYGISRPQWVKHHICQFPVFMISLRCCHLFYKFYFLAAINTFSISSVMLMFQYFQFTINSSMIICIPRSIIDLVMYMPFRHIFYIIVMFLRIWKMVQKMPYFTLRWGTFFDHPVCIHRPVYIFAPWSKTSHWLIFFVINKALNKAFILCHHIFVP